MCPLFLSAQLQNLDFEDWQTDTKLNYWQCGVIFGENDSFSEHFYFGNNADAHHNNYALTLGMWYFYVKDAAIQRAPISYLPEKLTGYYKYTENLLEKEGEYVVDTAQVNVFLTKWDPAISQRDTIGIGELKLGEEQLNYQLFEVAIHRVYRSFEKTHALNTFIFGDTNDVGTEVIVGGQNKGDRYRINPSAYHTALISDNSKYTRGFCFGRYRDRDTG